ncbi:MAG TPA: hypothetical protein VFT99_00930, partial [Roseiflexaceae bacterium]|nr:hypothetical protein [Roseiflexaceae bacterium]
MDCREACNLIDQGVEPGSGNPLQAALGFHLAGCAACRAYRQRVHQQLLAGLLFQTPPRTHRPAPVAKPAARKRGLSPEWRRFVAAVAGLAVLAVALLVGRVAVAALSIQRNVQAYIVPTPTSAAIAVAAPIPTLAQLPPLEEDPAAPAGSGASVPPAQVNDEGHPALPGGAQEEQATAQPARVTPSPSLASNRQIIPIVPTVARSVTEIPTLAPITPTPVMPLPGSAVNILLLGSDQ